MKHFAFRVDWSEPLVFLFWLQIGSRAQTANVSACGPQQLSHIHWLSLNREGSFKNGVSVFKRCISCLRKARHSKSLTKPTHHQTLPRAFTNQPVCISPDRIKLTFINKKRSTAFPKCAYIVSGTFVAVFAQTRLESGVASRAPQEGLALNEPRACTPTPRDATLNTHRVRHCDRRAST